MDRGLFLRPQTQERDHNIRWASQVKEKPRPAQRRKFSAGAIRSGCAHAPWVQQDASVMSVPKAICSKFTCAYVTIGVQGFGLSRAFPSSV